ncbi:MFS transporter [Fusobacterium perfoetens]|uniref:MFS transporter n=1 Tax=Fusobacterium perfoetens TaxID=852 RepID=UPI0004804C87|nr:MFS transporter [Fusobacterium perfoetens]
METSGKIELRGWGIVIIGWAAFMLANLSNFAFGIILPDMRQEIGFGLETSGWLSAVAWIGKGLLTIPISLFITKAKPKRILQIIFLVLGSGMLLQGFATNIVMLFVGRLFVMGVAAGILSVLVLFKIQYIPKDKMGFINGIETFAGPAGQTLGTIAIPFLLAIMTGWRSVMILMGFVGIALSILWTFVCKDKNENKVEEVKKEKKSILAPLKEAISQKNVLLLALGWPGTSLTWIAIYTFWPTYAVETLGLTLVQAGMVLGFLPVASMISSLLSPIIAKKIGYDKPIICLSGLVLPISYFAMLQTSNIPLLCLASFISGYAAYSFVPLAFTVLYKIPNLSSEAVSLGTGFIFTLVGLGGALGGSLAGILGSTFGLYKAIALTCLAPFIFFILTLFLDETGEKAQMKKAQEVDK